jgi:hypothetical protein
MTSVLHWQLLNKLASVYLSNCSHVTVFVLFLRHVSRTHTCLMFARAQFDALEAQIHDLECQLARLRLQRNGFLTVCQLPDEIVVQVFKLVQHGRQNYDEIEPWKTHDSSWIHLMSTCRRFRDVAVRTPLLWTLIDYTHDVRWRALCLERSIESPLCIHDGLGTAGLELECFSRAQSAYLRVNSTANSRVLSSFGPLLRALRVHSDYEEEDEPCVAVTSALLGGAGTSLSYLNLKYARLVALPSPSSLVRLELDQVRIDNSKNLVSVLQSIPQIADVCLRNLTVEDAKRSQVESTALTYLPYLRTLFIEDGCYRVLEYLRMFPLPTKALGISVNCPDLFITMFGDPNPVQVHKKILRIWQTFSSQMDNTVQLSEGTLTMRGPRNVLVTSIHFGCWTPDRNFHGFGSSSPSFYVSFCETCIEHLNVEDLNITTLHLGTAMSDRPGLNENFDDTYYVRYLSRLRVVTLQGYRRAETKPAMMTRFENWIESKSGQIAQLRFVGCSNSLRTFAEELQRKMDDAPAVIWEEGESADHPGGSESESEGSEW